MARNLIRYQRGWDVAQYNRCIVQHLKMFANDYTSKGRACYVYWLDKIRWTEIEDIEQILNETIPGWEQEEYKTEPW
jgi:hypothetical protein